MGGTGERLYSLGQGDIQRKTYAKVMSIKSASDYLFVLSKTFIKIQKEKLNVFDT